MSRSASLLLCLPIAAVCGALPAQEPAQPGFDHEHKQLTSVLSAVVHDDRVDYEALARDHAALDQYVAKLVTQDGNEFTQWTKAEQCAFWVNAYNAFTLQTVLVNYPLQDIDSLRDVGGDKSGKVWKQRTLRLGHLIPGQKSPEISLEELVELVLRPQFKDARVHSALCTGCLGSPALRPAAFSAPALDKELDSAARAWLADPRRTKYSRERKLVEASSVFDTYREDFVRDAGSVEAWIARFSPLGERAWMKEAGAFERKSLAFDWKLNDIDRTERR